MTMYLTTISIGGSKKENLRKFLLSFKTLTELFHENCMIVNPDKCSYMSLGKNNDDDTFSFN